MTDTNAQEETSKPKTKKAPLIVGLLLALLGGGGGFYAVWSGMLFGDSEPKMAAKDGAEPEGPVMAFVEIDPLVISMNTTSGQKLLRFRVALEVPDQHLDEVSGLVPRVVDLMNLYLRALEVTDLQDPAALTRLRSQMLRRIQVVTGEGRVNDMLIMEFVLT